MISWLAALALVVAPAGYSFPALTGRVVDAAHVLKPQDVAAIAGQSASLERQTGHQLVVVTVKSLGGHTIEDFARALGNRWGIGRKNRDDGVLLVVAPTERKVRIETGAGLTRSLTDREARAIIDHDALPAFTAANYSKGVRMTVNGIIGEIGPRQRKAA